MGTIQWQSYEWLTKERWGNFNPNKPEVWYCPDMVQVSPDGTMRLGVRYKPTLVSPNGEVPVVVPYQVGFISCTAEFGYGRFEIEAKLPQQPYAWPAFWMYSWDSWPPEIDVFEAYSNKSKKYTNFSLSYLFGRFWRVASNIHLGKEPNNYNLGAKYHFFGFKDPSKNFIKYAVEWTSDKIEIFYDNRSVRKITDNKVLEQLRGKKMNVILNNSFQKEIVGDENIKDMWFEVKNFKYTSL